MPRKMSRIDEEVRAEIMFKYRNVDIDSLNARLKAEILKNGNPTTKTNYELVMQSQLYWDEWLNAQKMKRVKTPKKKPANKPKKKRGRSIIKKGLYKK